MVNPTILELPFLLAPFAISAAMMGLSGHDLRLFHTIRYKMDQGSFPGFVDLHTNGIEKVDTVTLAVNAILFVFIIICLFLGCVQFKGRKGDYSGRGTDYWMFVGIALFTLCGPLLGLAAAFTNYAAFRNYSFTAGTAYSEPFTGQQQFYLRQIYTFIKDSTAVQTLNVPDLAYVGLTSADLGVFGTITTLAQLNNFLGSERYLDYPVYRAYDAIQWLSLSVTFAACVVHFALPYVLECFGGIKPPKAEKVDSEYEY